LNRIDQAFVSAREEDRAVLIVFVTAGDPDLTTTAELVPELQAAGADIVELGIPHSDPIAEGPTIQASTARALRHRTRLTEILDLSRRIREVSDVPLVLMGYLNNVLAYGEEQLVQACASAGVDGLIVADVPYEESQTLQTACEAKGVHRVLLVAPTSTPERVVQIASRSRGFVYCVSVTGVTGARAELPPDLQWLVARIQRVTSTPVAVGFGVSTPEQAAEVARLADGVIVGSALVSRLGEASGSAQAIQAASEFVRALSGAIRSARRR
jgi:tryptophan synthase alpha chain